MRTNRKKRANKKIDKRALDMHNVENYVSDLDYLARLTGVSPSTKDWIECRMLELRDSANVFEHYLAGFLMEHGVKFIHQAPFVFDCKKIYFADFYLPEHRMVIEVDGTYHQSDSQFAYDNERNNRFASMKIKTIRIPNEITKDTQKLKMRLHFLIK